MSKAEPNLVEVNRLIKGEPNPDAVNKTIDVEYALAVSRSENARLKDRARVDAETAARNEETHKKDRDGWRSKTLELQEQLLASQEKVYELQDKLLSLRQIVNGA